LANYRQKHLLLFQSIVAEESNFAEVEFSNGNHHPKSVIPTGGTAVLGAPERRNPSSTSDFGLKSATVLQ
jgi:hypothetical protein